MICLILTFFCIGTVLSNYEAPPVASNGGEYIMDPSFNDYYPEEYEHDHHHKSHKRGYRKLKHLDGDPGIFAAEIKYYRDNGKVYALISCAHSPGNRHYNYVLANPNKFRNDGVLDQPTGTMAMAGGMNITYTARYGKEKKWLGEDFLQQKEWEFTKVGCFEGRVGM